jgi:hypothetical protein
MHDIMNKNITVRTKVVTALCAPITPETTYALAVRSGGEACGGGLEDACAGVARRGAVLDVDCVYSARGKVCEMEGKGEDVHGLIWLDGEQVVIAPRQMRRAHDHKPAHITIRRHIAYFRQTPRAQETLAFELGVAYAETWWGGVWQAGGKSHHH